MELVAELRGGGGGARSVRVQCPPADEGEPGGRLRALRLGLGELQERVSQLLASLEREQRPEAGSGGGAEEVDDDDDDDEEEGGEDEEENNVEENNVDAAARPEDPPPKRTRVQRP